MGGNDGFNISLTATFEISFKTFPIFNTSFDCNEKYFRLRNKGVYVKMGLRKMVGRKMCKDLHKAVKLEVDGKPVELPAVEGIIILNILR